jgi:hypothetical protein
MRQVLRTSLATTAVAVFIMLLLLFLMSTSQPYLLAVVVVEMIVGYVVFRVFLQKQAAGNTRKATLFLVLAVALLALLIFATVIGLLYLF